MVWRKDQVKRPKTSGLGEGGRGGARSIDREGERLG